MRDKVYSIPSASRLITSMRDLGYDFIDAVSEIVDNSIQADANCIQIKLVFKGEDSYLLVLDNGKGMSSSQIEEALRFGSSRPYGDNDLGRFGLGLKTASLSQCDNLVLSSRQSQSRCRISSFMWSIDHVKKTNEWEILPIDSKELPDEVRYHFSSTVGTAVYWGRLGRLLGYKYPVGKYAEQEFDRMLSELRFGLGATFHKFLSGELSNKRVVIFVNDVGVKPWDPFCRSEPHTKALKPFELEFTYREKISKVTFRPFLLPTSQEFSSLNAFNRAGGLQKWNKQQGFYIYRAGRLLQSGGWSTLRTADEHTKLIRIMLDIPEGMDEAFSVNISKMRVSLPKELRALCIDALGEIIKAGQEKYRMSSSKPIEEQPRFNLDNITVVASKFDIEAHKLLKLMEAVSKSMSLSERKSFIKRFELCSLEIQ